MCISREVVLGEGLDNDYSSLVDMRLMLHNCFSMLDRRAAKEALFPSVIKGE